MMTTMSQKIIDWVETQRRDQLPFQSMSLYFAMCQYHVWYSQILCMQYYVAVNVLRDLRSFPTDRDIVPHGPSDERD